MTDKKNSRGRPGTGHNKVFAFRVEDSIIQELDRIADAERVKTGYKIDRSDIARKAFVELIDRYNTGGRE